MRKFQRNFKSHSFICVMSRAKTAKIPILTYHSIDKSGSVISTDPEIFDRQMKFLSDNEFKVISLNTLLKYLSGNLTVNPKTIVLTFDDGFQNFYETAFPVLSRYNFTATVFLITDYCGKLNDWLGNLPGMQRMALMSWDKIKELNAYNFEFAAHSRTHADLTKLEPAKAFREIVESKTIIEDRLGGKVKNFAYPYGRYNSIVKKLTEKHFETASSTNLGKVGIGDDPFSLKRVDAYYLSNERVFRSICSVGFDRYLGVRQALRKLKGALNNSR